MDMTRIRPQRIRLFGESVDLTTPAEVMSFTAKKVAAGQRAIVANHNTHSLYLVSREPEMREFYASADLIELDSIPMIFWGMLTRKPVNRGHRCTYLDWRDDFWRLAARHGWRVFYLGGAPGVPELAARAIRARYPTAIVGGRHGYFDDTPGSADNAAVMAEINAFRPDILMVGMGMPRQELWIARHYDALNSGVVFSVGAAFDYEAGVQKAAPRWLSRLGGEWAFRLIADPRRMSYRYLVEPWSLMPKAIRDMALTFAPRPRRSVLGQPLPERRKTLG
jgi:N-acetylglucosaminyldiphosphoundecaprenol N-acetyl-beta-D-mannosaminyltransferase